MTDSEKYAANMATGANNVYGAVLGFPHAVGAIGDWAINKMGGSPENPGWLTRHTYSGDEINKWLADNGGPSTPELAFMPTPELVDAANSPKTQYKPETFMGKLGQDVLSTAPLAMVGGGGIAGLLGRQIANVGGNAGAEGAKEAFPNSPGAQMVGGIIGAILSDNAATLAGNVGTAARKITGFGRNGVAEANAAQQLVDTAKVPATDLVNTIDQNTPLWQFPNGNGTLPATQPLPTTAALTGNAGLQGATYRDMVQAQRDGNQIYRDNANITNQAQREAMAAATPDIQPQLVANQNIVQNALSQMPSGVTAQEAGSTFRQNLKDCFRSTVGCSPTGRHGF